MELKIIRDDDPLNPRTDWDHLGVMMCFHKRLILGDKEHAGLYTSDFDGWEAMEEELYKRGAVVVLPLYLYEHSGITMSVGAFSDPFDSGQVGFIYAMREAVLKEYNLKRNITKKTLAAVTERLKSEVETYDQYLRGDVWGYVIEDNGEHVDSCWGFFGEEHAREEGEHALKVHEEEKRKRAQYVLDFHTADNAEVPHVQVEDVTNGPEEPAAVACFYILNWDVSAAEDRALEFIEREVQAGRARRPE